MAFGLKGQVDGTLQIKNKLPDPVKPCGTLGPDKIGLAESWGNNSGMATSPVEEMAQLVYITMILQ